MKLLESKTVFITGGLSGIGKACAIAAAREGANIVIADLKTTGFESVISEVIQLNSKAKFIECDVSVFSQVESAIKQTVDTFGTLDVALNNAGIGGVSAKTGEMSELEWLSVISINLNGVFNCMRHELNQMTKQKNGIIINMSSILGKVGFAFSSHYVAAKHGIIGLSKAAALEYATEGIRINVICPGFIETPLLERAGIVEESEVKKMIMNAHPMKRFGHSEEVAKAFLFLSSDTSSFITGSTLDVDGGYLAQ